MDRVPSNFNRSPSAESHISVEGSHDRPSGVPASSTTVGEGGIRAGQEIMRLVSRFKSEEESRADPDEQEIDRDLIAEQFNVVTDSHEVNINPIETVVESDRRSPLEAAEAKTQVNSELLENWHLLDPGEQRQQIIRNLVKEIDGNHKLLLQLLSPSELSHETGGELRDLLENDRAHLRELGARISNDRLQTPEDLHWASEQMKTALENARTAAQFLRDNVVAEGPIHTTRRGNISAADIDRIRLIRAEFQQNPPEGQIELDSLVSTAELSFSGSEESEGLANNPLIRLITAEAGHESSLYRADRNTALAAEERGDRGIARSNWLSAMRRAENVIVRIRRYQQEHDVDHRNRTLNGLLEEWQRSRNTAAERFRALSPPAVDERRRCSIS